MSNEFADYKQQMLGTSNTNGETRKIKTDNNGVLQISLVGSLPNQTLVEQKTQADAVGGVITFSANINAIEIYNTDPSNIGIFTVNGIAINVPATKVFKSVIGGVAGVTVTVTGATSYIVSRYV